MGSPNYDNFSIEYNKVMVMFSKDGGDGGTNYIEAMYGQDMPIAEAPQKQNFDFQGYFSELNGNGTQYYDENMNSINTWDKTEPTILYAFWTAAENKVYLDKQDGSDVTDFVTVSLNQDMPAGIVAPERSGYTFAGYFAEENGNGKKYYNAEMISVNVWDSTTGGTIYAFWISNSYTVVFEKEGGVGGDSYITATFGAQMPNAVAPTKVGFEFNGYYIGDKCYYDKNMQSRCVWDIPENAVLSAQWTPKEYIIELNHDYGDIIEKITVAFGDDMPEGDIPQRMGYTFHGYFEAQNGKGAQYYSAEMNSLKKWEIDNDGTLYAYWTIIEYTINYQVDDWKGQTNPNPTSYTVEDEIIFENLEADGYNFNWTPANIIQGSINNITVSGIWINKPYTIILDNQAYVAVFDMDMPQAPIPIRQGYTFNGYFYNGIKYYNADMTSAHKWDEAHNATLEAEWIPNIYEITLSTGKVYATYGEAMPEASIPVKTGYKFFGYFTETNGAGDMYYDAEMQSVREWDIAKDTTLYPYWKQLYTVTFNKGGGVGGTNSVEVVYGEDMPIAIAPAMAYNKFNGYYLNGDNNPYYLADMTSNRKMDQQQDITLIAKYTPIQYTISYNLDDSLSLPASNDSRNALSITYYDTVTLYAPYREHFEFDAWDLNGVEVTTLENIDSNITLTAKWIGIRAVPTPNGTNNYDSPFVNIEFTRIITNVSYNINIGPNVKELYIFANFTNPIDVTMSIVVLDKVVSTGGLIISQRNSALKLTISNVNITAVSGSHAILMDSEYSLILYSYNSSITGSSTLTPKNDTLTTKQGSSAIYCKHLILNTSVTLKGGSNSSMSSTPFVGGVAVSLVEGGDIFLQSDGVKIIGGSCNGLIGYAGCAVYANNGNYKIIDREYYSVQIDYGAGTEPNLSTNPPYVGY